MTYATGVATGPDDFITQLCAFAVTNAGFADQGTVTSSAGSGSRTIRRISKGGIWWSFLRYSTNVGIAGAMGYTGLGAGSTVPVNPVGADKQSYYTQMGTWAFTGPYVGHYFFTDGTCVHAVLEIAAGIFNHISLGKVTGVGGFSYGEYLTAGAYQTSNTGGVWAPWNSGFCTRPFNDGNQASTGAQFSFIRTGNTGATADFGALQGTTAPSHGMFVGATDAGDYSLSSMWYRAMRDAPNDTTNRTPLFPGIFRLFDTPSGLYRIAGTVPDVAFMLMTPDMNPKDLILTDWQIFPLTMRTGGDQTVAAISNEWALAYRRH